MTSNSRELSNLALEFRRLGASIIKQEEAATGFLPVGAKKRKQPPRGAAVQPSPRQRPRAVAIDWDRFLNQPTELVFRQLRFMLRPRFLPEYEWKEVPVDPDDPDALSEERWVRVHPQHRRKHMLDEIWNLAKAYGFLLRQSRFYDLLTDSYLRVELYRDWLRQPPPRLWLDAKNLPPSHGVGHTKAEIDEFLFKSIRELDPRIEIPMWYSTYLANTFFFEYVCNHQWSTWKWAYAIAQTTNSPHPSDARKFLWDGQWTKLDKIKHQFLWLGVKPNTLQPLPSLNIRVKLLSEIGPEVLTRTTGPGFYSHDGVFTKKTAAAWFTVPGSDSVNLAAAAAASLTAVSVLRIPSLSLPKNLDLQVRGFYVTVGYDVKGLIQPVLLWEEPVLAKTRGTQRVPEDPLDLPHRPTKYVLWPDLQRCMTEGVLMGNGMRAMQMISLMQAQHPDARINILDTAELKSQPQSTQDRISGRTSWPEWSDRLSRREWDLNRVRPFQPGATRIIEKPEDMPDYMKPYDIYWPRKWNLKKTKTVQMIREENEEDEIDRMILDEEGGDETLGGFIVPDDDDDDDDEYSEAVFRNPIVY